MEVCVEEQLEALGFAGLSSVIPAERKAGYASKPQKAADIPVVKSQEASLPAFINTIQLNTLDSNLYLRFGFAESAEQAETALISNQVMMSSETAKQLLITLAELFQCKLEPGKK